MFGRKYKMERDFYVKHIEVYQWGRMIDEEDLKRKINSLLQLVFMELDVFHLYCHQCQRGRLLEL